MTPLTAIPPQAPPAAAPDPLRAAAQRLETGFLAEMLKTAGLGAAPSGWGGGAGEEQFRSFLVEAQAERITAAGGIGLADALYRSLSRNAAGAP
ncbi:rod-binding protein [Limimaricola pyoseonensis]|uniref:Rod binding protein n=1 Tax=Limimaricola pyoseonensis TaxID=521013 RepID=A0A1G7EPA2_9RHOB|nr:rod-binding protein [Limimaricola pyoseonensis]SDE65543.1 Rod binding protein [Limimaricola pyoseonensis]